MGFRPTLTSLVIEGFDVQKHQRDLRPHTLPVAPNPQSNEEVVVDFNVSSAFRRRMVDRLLSDLAGVRVATGETIPSRVAEGY